VDLLTTHYQSHRFVFIECKKVMFCRKLGIVRYKVVRGAFQGPRSTVSYSRDKSYDSILDPRPEALYDPTQSPTRSIWNEVLPKAEVSGIDKTSLKTLPKSYEYDVYITLLFKSDHRHLRVM
jgi:hypothetical protein